MDIYASYEVQIQGTRSKIMARIAYTPRLLNSFLDELRSLILNDQNHVENDQSENKTKKPIVVGLAFISPTSDKVIVMQLCFGTCCIIIQLNHLDVIPESLRTFLSDEDIAFVGVCIRNGLHSLKSDYGLECRSVIELGTLADRVYRTSKYSEATLEDLASEVGIGFEIPDLASEIGIGFEFLKLTSHFWFSRDLSNEQIEYATITAYASYLIGYKLLTSGGRK